MEAHEKRGIGSIIIGLVTTASTLLGSGIDTPYTTLMVVGGLALTFIGAMQFRHAEQFTVGRSTSRRRQVAVFDLAIASFVGGFLYALA